LASSVAVIAIVFASIFLGEAIVWGDESNFQATGGFGPNQVSAAIGVAALAIWLLIVYGKLGTLSKIALTLTCVGFLALDVLTFSRGGVYAALVAGLAVIPLELLRGRQSSAALLPLILAALLSIYIVLPQIDELTGGAASARFMDSSMTGRDVLAEEDIQLFFDNPLMGVGVGISKELRLEMNGVAAHTEYTRLLAEHGLLGISAIAMLVLMGLQNFRRNWESPSAQSIVMAAALWALLIMSHSATRLVAPSFMFGLIFAEFALDEPEAPREPSPRYRGMMAIR
jgi:O-antigen ligase